MSDKSQIEQADQRVSVPQLEADAGPPESKKSEGRVKVLYVGPSDNFVVEVNGEGVVTNRNEPVELPKSTLEWLQTRYPGHSWGVVKD